MNKKDFEFLAFEAAALAGQEISVFCAGKTKKQLAAAINTATQTRQNLFALAGFARQSYTHMRPPEKVVSYQGDRYTVGYYHDGSPNWFARISGD